MSNVNLPFPPYKSQLVDKYGNMTSQWQKWFQQLYLRTGQAIAVPNVPAVTTPQLLTSSYVDIANTTVYTSPLGQNTIIDTFQAANTDPVGAHSLSVYLVPVNSTPSTSNLSINNLIIQPNSTVTIPALQNQVIGGGGYIVCVASSVGSIKVPIYGRQVS